jgi:hypothetical protein
MKRFLITMLCLAGPGFASRAQSDPAELAKALDAAAQGLVRKAAADLTTLQSYAEQEGRTPEQAETARKAMQDQYPEGIEVRIENQESPRPEGAPRYALAWAENEGGGLSLSSKGFGYRIWIPPQVFGQTMVGSVETSWPADSWLLIKGRPAHPLSPIPAGDALINRLTPEPGTWLDQDSKTNAAYQYRWAGFRLGTILFHVVSRSPARVEKPVENVAVTAEPSVDVKVLKMPETIPLPSQFPVTQAASTEAKSPETVRTKPPAEAAVPPVEPQPTIQTTLAKPGDPALAPITTPPGKGLDKPATLVEVQAPTTLPAKPVTTAVPASSSAPGVLNALWSGAYMVGNGATTYKMRAEIRHMGDAIDVKLDWADNAVQCRGDSKNGIFQAEGSGVKLEGTHQADRDAIKGSATLPDGSVRSFYLLRLKEIP